MRDPTKAGGNVGSTFIGLLTISTWISTVLVGGPADPGRRPWDYGSDTRKGSGLTHRIFRYDGFISRTHTTHF